MKSHLVSVSETSSPLIRTFRIHRPAGFNYHAGQAVNIYVPTQDQFASTPATFSMLSAPKDGQESSLEIAAKSTNYSPIRWLFDRAQVGEPILVDGRPLGRMHLPLLQTPTDPIILIGGGIGITPILSIVDHLTSLKPSDPQPLTVDVIHQASNPTEFLLWNRLVEFLPSHPRSKLLFFISDPPSTGQIPDLHPLIRPHVSFGVVNESVLEALNPSSRHNVVICGPPGFVDSTKSVLVNKLGVRDERIFV